MKSEKGVDITQNVEEIKFFYDELRKIVRLAIEAAQKGAELSEKQEPYFLIEAIKPPGVAFNFPSDLNLEEAFSSPEAMRQNLLLIKLGTLIEGEEFRNIIHELVDIKDQPKEALGKKE